MNSLRLPLFPVALFAASLAPASLAPASFAAPTAADLEKLGGKVREQDGAVVELACDTASFTETEYRLIGQCAALEKLSLNGKTLDDSTLPLLAGLGALEELSTNQTTLSDEGYRHFAALKNLRVLHLWHPSFGKPGFTGAGLVHLKELPKLERLTFAGATAGDGALAAIGQLTQLKFFQTWHTAQTLAGNGHLTKLPNLTTLKIGQRLPKWGTDAPPSFDGSSIATLAKIASLETLELFEARLTFDDLAALTALPKLQRLAIHTTDIAGADIEKLRAAMPGVTIDFKPITAEEKTATLEKKLRLYPAGAGGGNPP